MPAVTLQQVLQLLRTIATGRIGTRALIVLVPALQNRVDPLPGGLDFVAAHEQRRVAVDHVEQQALLGVPAALLAEGIGQVEIQLHGFEVHTLAGILGHQLQADALLRLQADQ